MTDTVTKPNEKNKVFVVPPFGVEADHPRNSDLLIQSVPGLRLRSAIDGAKPITDVKTGDQVIPTDQAQMMSGFPKTPGMQIHVNPDDGSYAIIDPLFDDASLCERVTRYLNQKTGFRISGTIKGVPPQNGKLDVHRMKTLCRELVNIVNSGEGKIVKGALPDADDIEDLAGDFLLNPGSRVTNTQPTFEKDWDEWVAGLSRSGG